MKSSCHPFRGKWVPFVIIGTSLFLNASIVLSSEIIVTVIRGNVQAKRASEGIWMNVKPGLILKSGDSIRTGKRSHAVTVTKEGHRLFIKEKTTLEITSLGPMEWDFSQGIGRTRLKVAKLSGGQTLRVRTPTAVCAVRGTEFQVTVLEDLSTVLDVFQGQVGFGDLAGRTPEVPIIENQRSAVAEQGTAPKEPEPIPAKVMEEMKREDTDIKKEEKKYERRLEEEQKREGRLPPREPDRRLDEKTAAESDAKEEFRREIAGEVALDLQRSQVEADAAFELQANQYQESKTLIDAFGQRVRLEEYITRPAPEAYKLVTLNTRADRFDFAAFEVVANKPLPEKISDAGNLWFSQGSAKPEFFAVKERWFVSNDRDSAAEVHLDGDSMPVTFQKALFSDDGGFLGVTDQRGYQTVFDHKYKFLNGTPASLDRLWSDKTFRPLDNGALSGVPVAGLMWHMRPVRIERYDPASGLVASDFWSDAFVTGQGSGLTATGKMELTEFFQDPDPNLAHVIEKHSYINFQDTNGNGRLDQGERFADLNGDGVWDADEPFDDVVQVGLGGARDAARRFEGTGDSRFFSDQNRDGLFNDAVSGSDPFIVAREPWAWEKNESFMVDDFGKIVDYRDVGLDAVGEGGASEDAVSDAFEKLNYERVFTSSEFGGRKIDVVLTPRTLLRAGFIRPNIKGNEPVDLRP